MKIADNFANMLENDLEIEQEAGEAATQVFSSLKVQQNTGPQKEKKT